MNTENITLDEWGNPILDQLSADGFVDCTFRIAEVSANATGYDLTLVATHRGSLVGFDATVRRGLRGGFDSAMNLIPEHVYRPAVEVRRAGAQSDLFVAILAELYGFPSAPRRMIDRLQMTGIALHHDNVDMEREPIRIKLFGHDDDEQVQRDEYFESFFNLDLRNRFVYWNEKDPDYRYQLIAGLSA